MLLLHDLVQFFWDGLAPGSRGQQAFLGAADIWPLLIQPLLGETLPQTRWAGWVKAAALRK